MWREGLLYISEYTQGIPLPTKEAFRKNEREQEREGESVQGAKSLTDHNAGLAKSV